MNFTATPGVCAVVRTSARPVLVTIVLIVCVAGIGEATKVYQFPDKHECSQYRNWRAGQSRLRVRN